MKMKTMVVILCIFEFSGLMAIDYVESWNNNDTAGWQSSGILQLSCVDGSLNMKFGSQIVPDGDSDIVYKEIRGIIPTNISFKFKSQQVPPSALYLYLEEENGRGWYKEIAIKNAGIWSNINVKVSFDSGWSRGPDSDLDVFLYDMGRIHKAGIYLRRHGFTGEQNYLMDDFVLSGVLSTVKVQIAGMITYNGIRTGNVIVYANSIMDGSSYKTVISGPGFYSIKVKPMNIYKLSAFLDWSGDYVRGTLEPYGEYQANPVSVGLNDISSVNIHLTEPLSARDSDSDGLSDADEEKLGTDPFDSDTDKDGLSDWYEYWNGLNPLDPWNRPLGRVEIIEPTTNLYYITTSSVIRLSGMVYDPYGISAVVYTNSRFGQGDCIGKSNWYVDVELYPGTNKVTVSYKGIRGNGADDTIYLIYRSSDPKIDDEILRAGMAVEEINVPLILYAGRTVLIRWRVLSYVPLISAVRIRLNDGRIVTLNGQLCGVEEGRWRIKDRYSKIYSFSRYWTVPDVPGDCRIRFLCAQMDGYAWMNANIPGGVDLRPYGNDGKEILRTIEKGSDVEIESEDVKLNPPYFDSLEKAILRAGATIEEISIPDDFLAGNKIVCRWKVLSYVPVRSRIRIIFSNGEELMEEGKLVNISAGRWKIGNKDSKVYTFEKVVTVPDVPGDCRIRFLCAQMDGYAWMNANIPGGVDLRPYGNDGKEILRTIRENESLSILYVNASPRKGEISFNGDIDLYEFEVEVYGEYEIYVISQGKGLTEINMEVYNNSLISRSTSYVRLYLEPARYKVKVYGKGTGDYFIGVNRIK